MPKINAPTVPQHRAAQRRALLEAASQIIIADGASAVNPKTVGERAGMSRTAVYDYFASRDDILVAIAIDAFESWAAELAEDLRTAESGLPRLRRYIEATMTMAGDGRHDLAAELRSAELSPRRVEEIVALHDAMLRPLITVLTEAGVTPVSEIAPYVQAIISVGLTQVTAGMPPAEVAARTYDLVVAGVPRASSR